MKTEKEIEQDILKITMEIKGEFPELYKHISEMPIEMPENGTPEVNKKCLVDYYDSLDQLYTKYKEKRLKIDQRKKQEDTK